MSEIKRTMADLCERLRTEDQEREVEYVVISKDGVLIAANLSNATANSIIKIARLMVAGEVRP